MIIDTDVIKWWWIIHSQETMFTIYGWVGLWAMIWLIVKTFESVPKHTICTQCLKKDPEESLSPIDDEYDFIE